MTAENGFAAIPLQHAIDRLNEMRLSDHSLESALQQVATLAKQAIPGASEVSVSLLTKDRADTVVSTGQLATDVDESQYERGYGPCLDAARSGEMQIIEDASSETRWGDYTKAAVTYGALSSVSAPINLQQTPAVAAALNIYSTRAHAFDPASVQSAATLASYAEHTLVNFHHHHGTRELVRQLAEALEARPVIDQAKGILMRDRGCTADEAFDLLVSASQRTNRKVRLVAEDVVQSVSRSVDRQRGNS